MAAVDNSDLELVKLGLSLITTVGLPTLYYVLRLTVRDAIHTAEATSADTAKLVADKAEAALDKHEEMDQRRHEENLGNFEKGRDVMQEILVRLARAGINGKPH
jgi:hypothetical protein